LNLPKYLKFITISLTKINLVILLKWQFNPSTVCHTHKYFLRPKLWDVYSASRWYFQQSLGNSHGRCVYTSANRIISLDITFDNYRHHSLKCCYWRHFLRLRAYFFWSLVPFHHRTCKHLSMCSLQASEHHHDSDRTNSTQERVYYNKSRWEFLHYFTTEINNLFVTS